MHRSGADADCFRSFEDSCARHQLCADTLNDIGAQGASPEALSLCSGACEAGIDPASDHRSLELGECAGYLEQQAACRRRGVDVLLIQVEIDPDRF
jgi:hypothetical protein